MTTRHQRSAMLAALTAFLMVATAASAHEGEHEGAAEVMRINTVVPGSAAEKAGLLAGDRILAWNGQKITTQSELDALLATARKRA